jgi:enamine deaminase RidA (YjgF/YER057c/UK114 family)
MSRHRIVNAPELGQPIGFSHAIVADGRTIHLAGQIGAGATLVEQFDDAARRLIVALRAAGGVPEDLVSLQVFVTDVGAYKSALPALGAVWREHFGRHYPAMGLFGIRELFEPEAQVELMGVAVLAG